MASWWKSGKRRCCLLINGRATCTCTRTRTRCTYRVACNAISMIQPNWRSSTCLILTKRPFLPARMPLCRLHLTSLSIVLAIHVLLCSGYSVVAGSTAPTYHYHHRYSAALLARNRWLLHFPQIPLPANDSYLTFAVKISLFSIFFGVPKLGDGCGKYCPRSTRHLHIFFVLPVPHFWDTLQLSSLDLD